MKASDLKVGLTVKHPNTRTPIYISAVWTEGNLVKFYGASGTVFAFKKSQDVEVLDKTSDWVIQVRLVCVDPKFLNAFAGQITKQTKDSNGHWEVVFVIHNQHWETFRQVMETSFGYEEHNWIVPRAVVEIM